MPTGERYKTIAKERRAFLKGEYGHPGKAGERRVTGPRAEGAFPATCRPADLLAGTELEAGRRAPRRRRHHLAGNAIDDVLTVALFPQIGLKSLENRHNPAAFEPSSRAEAAQLAAAPAKPQSLVSTPWKWKAKPLW
ncbi:hypothetical protein KCP74_01075 [Salmonella enterica subsp. enterica]|nr:hypothetical protein KCP74_01075 [Salmonella enterica subsp. enterica]